MIFNEIKMPFKKKFLITFDDIMKESISILERYVPLDSFSDLVAVVIASVTILFLIPVVSIFALFKIRRTKRFLDFEYAESWKND